MMSADHFFGRTSLASMDAVRFEMHFTEYFYPHFIGQINMNEVTFNPDNLPYVMKASFSFIPDDDKIISILKSKKIGSISNEKIFLC